MDIKLLLEDSLTISKALALLFTSTTIINYNHINYGFALIVPTTCFTSFEINYDDQQQFQIYNNA